MFVHVTTQEKGIRLAHHLTLAGYRVELEGSVEEDPVDGSASWVLMLNLPQVDDWEAREAFGLALRMMYQGETCRQAY